jgi:hypothetical protein
LLLDELDQALQRLDKLVVPDTEIADGAATAPLDFCRLDDNETGAAGREFPAFIRCQSVGNPLTAEYWCIGGTTMRLRSSRPRMVSGENSNIPDI